jgi:hypothetical protein
VLRHPRRCLIDDGRGHCRPDDRQCPGLAGGALLTPGEVGSGPGADGVGHGVLGGGATTILRLVARGGKRGSSTHPSSRPLSLVATG